MNALDTRRQRVRRACLLVALLLFPVILNYLSPYIITVAAAEGVVNGSMVVFGLMFLGSLTVGRAWCAWGCPAGALQEALIGVNDRPAPGGWRDAIKWFIWVPWLALILASAIRAGGLQAVRITYMTEGIISVLHPESYVIYYGVVGLTMVLALTVGKRGMCHYVCWMAPFMILGRKLSNLARLPALRLRADASACHDCLRCNRNCPMSLDVNGMVHRGRMEDAECILCATCADTCSRGAIRIEYGRGR